MKPPRQGARPIQHVVLDSSALLAALLVEPGGDTVADTMKVAVMSSVNAAEVVSKLVDRGLTLSKAQQAFGLFQLDIIPFDAAQAMAAAALRAPTVKHGLSLGDRACLALAQHFNVPAVTADKAWAKLDIGVEIKVVR